MYCRQKNFFKTYYTYILKKNNKSVLLFQWVVIIFGKTTFSTFKYIGLNGLIVNIFTVTHILHNIFRFMQFFSIFIGYFKTCIVLKQMLLFVPILCKMKTNYIPNSSSMAMITSTWSKESNPRSLIKCDSRLSWNNYKSIVLNIK